MICRKRLWPGMLALCLCLLSLPVLAWAEEPADSAPQGSTLVQEEEVIAPAYPVPEHVTLLLDAARNELGYTEEKSGYTKYGEWSGDGYAEWCAEFLCWCVHQVDEQHGTQLLERQYPKYFSSNVGRDWFLREGRYVARKGKVPDWGSQWYKGESSLMERNSYIPQPGDWMFFSTSPTGDTTHVAMVEYCARGADGMVYVHVIEGNNPSSVSRNVYPIDNWAILGYGTVHDVADTTIRSGNEGKKVLALQEKLILLGYLESQYHTGKYASLTAEAVNAFQKAEGISQTGIAGHETQLRLQECVDEHYETHSEYWIVGE